MPSVSFYKSKIITAGILKIVCWTKISIKLINLLSYPLSWPKIKPTMKLMLTLFLFCCFTGADAQNIAITDSVIDPHFAEVEKEAEYPGGSGAWIKYLQKNLKPNTPIDHNAPVGSYNVIARFIVSKDGTLSNITFETNEGYGMEQEVQRILNLSGVWIPAEQNGRKVNAYRRQPITFIVDQDNFTISTAKPHTLFTNTKNRIHISARKVKSENIELSISSGTITDIGDGDYTVQVSEPGRVIITVHLKNKKNPLGTESFVVEEKK
jgi:hypothetical protein